MSIGSGTDASVQDIREVIVEGNYAYTAGYETSAGDGLVVWDISDKRNPTKAAEEGTGLTVNTRVFLKDSIIYATSRSNGGFATIDVSNPESPSNLDSYSNVDMEGARGVTVVGDYAFVACAILGAEGTEGLAVFDVSDPSNISRVARVDTTDDSDMVSGGMVLADAENDLLYVSNYDEPGDSLLVYDISNPSSPTLATRVTSSNIDHARGLARKENYLFMASQVNGTIVAFDISTPSSPVEVSHMTHSVLDGARGITLIGNRLFVSSRAANKIVEVDVSDPEHMSISRTIDATNPYGSFVDDEYVYTATDNGELIVSKIRQSR